MRIAYLHWGFPPIIGGVETHLTILLAELVKKGHQIGLLTGSAPNTKVRYKFEGFEVFRSPLFDLNWLARRGAESLDEELNKVYKKFFDTVKPDVIHAHNMHYFSTVHAKLLDQWAVKKGVPLVLTAHNVWDDIQFLKLTRDIKWDHIVAVSHYIKKELMGVGYPENKITVIHHGIDINNFSPVPPSTEIYEKHPQLKGRKVVFHPARLGLAKGCDVSIKAIKLVREKIPDVVLVLAGTKNIIDWKMSQEKDIAYVVDLVKIFNLRDNVYINFFSLEDMPEIYRASDICIYPSTASEPFGLTMLEALASGKPMIVTNMGGMPEIIRDDIDGFIVKVKDYEILASRITQLLLDDELRARLGKTGRQTVQTHYTKEIMTDCHEKLYKEILTGVEAIV
ncbi:glycosyltransferase family 4 protein [bacterium]